MAVEVAEELCASVETSLLGQRIETFTRLSTVVRQALEAALMRILTPKKSTDLLAQVLRAKSHGVPYSIVFIGVNGVGKRYEATNFCNTTHVFTFLSFPPLSCHRLMLFVYGG